MKRARWSRLTRVRKTAARLEAAIGAVPKHDREELSLRLRLLLWSTKRRAHKMHERLAKLIAQDPPEPERPRTKAEPVVLLDMHGVERGRFATEEEAWAYVAENGLDHHEVEVVPASNANGGTDGHEG